MKCNNWCLNVTIQEAQDLSTRKDRMLYVHMTKLNKVLQVYPGGRKVLYPELPRYVERAHECQKLIAELLGLKIERMA